MFWLRNKKIIFCCTLLKRLGLLLCTFFEKNLFFLNHFICKIELSYVFTISMFSTAETAWKVNYLIKTGVFLLFVIIYVPPIVLDS